MGMSHPTTARSGGGRPGDHRGCQPGSVQDGLRLLVERNAAGWQGFMFDAMVALGVNAIGGDYVEFGAEGGNTLTAAWRAVSGLGQHRHLWAFDSFAGLPASADPRDRHPQFKPGYGLGLAAFHETVAGRGVPREAYTAVAGFYEETLRGRTEPADIALAYIDCNLYSSTVTVLEFLAPRLKHGMIVAFDDYYCWSPTGPSGERVAFLEFQAAHPEWHFLPFSRFNWGGLAFVVEDASQLPPNGHGRF